MVEMLGLALVGVVFFIIASVVSAMFGVYVDIAGAILAGVLDSVNNDIMKWILFVPTVIVLVIPLLYGIVWSLSVVGDGVITKIRGPQQVIVQQVLPVQAEKK